MARTEVIMPQMGESIAEGTIVKWHKKPGDAVKKDEVLLEISTDKVDSEIPSPASGVLAEIVVPEQQTVSVRTVIAYIETEGGAGVVVPAAAQRSAAPRSPGVPATGTPAAAPVAAATAGASPAGISAAGSTPGAGITAAGPTPGAGISSAPSSPGSPAAGGARFYSPLVLNIARTEGVSMEELERISGTGEGGRVSKKDILAYIAARAGRPPAAGPGAGAAPAAAQPRPAAGPASSSAAGSPPVSGGGLRSEIVPMSNVMQRMAHHMVQSIQTSPHVSAVHEVDMTAVSRHREAQAAGFERAEGFKLTYMPYIVDAVVRAIKKYPLINSSIDGTNIVRKGHINVGIAVASESGLIVPVIKNAEEKNFIGLARAINDLAVRTRSKKLIPDDIQGGTFTISNFGVFGTLIGTPIINQPQVAILGTGAITKRPVVIDDAIAIRSMAYFTLSFDHRLVDGALGGMFLEEIVRNLEEVRV